MLKLTCYLFKNKKLDIADNFSTSFLYKDTNSIFRIYIGVCQMGDEEIPISGKKLLSILEEKGPLTQKELIEESEIPARTARYALRRLIDMGLIVKRCNLSDMRSVYYFIVEN